MEVVTSRRDPSCRHSPLNSPSSKDVLACLQILSCSHEQNLDNFHSEEDFSNTAVVQLANNEASDYPNAFRNERLNTQDGSLWAGVPSQHVGLQLASWWIAKLSETSEDCRKLLRSIEIGCSSLALSTMAPERNVRLQSVWAMELLLREEDEKEAEWMEQAGFAWTLPVLEASLSAAREQDSELLSKCLAVLKQCVSSSLSAKERLLEEGLDNLRDLAGAVGQEGSSLVTSELVSSIFAASMASNKPISEENAKLWSPYLVKWATASGESDLTKKSAVFVLENVLQGLGMGALEITQAWLATLLLRLVTEEEKQRGGQGDVGKKSALQSERAKIAAMATAKLAHVVSRESAFARMKSTSVKAANDEHSADEDQPEISDSVSAKEAISAMSAALKSMADLSADDHWMQDLLISSGGIPLLRKLFLGKEYEEWLLSEGERHEAGPEETEAAMADLKKHSARLLNLFSGHQMALRQMLADKEWVAEISKLAGDEKQEVKLACYARQILEQLHQHRTGQSVAGNDVVWPRYEDSIFLIHSGAGDSKGRVESGKVQPELDIVFLHGLCGGPFKTWRIADDAAGQSGQQKVSLEAVDAEEGFQQQGMFWPKLWLSKDLPNARAISVKYKTNLSEWLGPTLPLQELSTILLEKLSAAGIGERPVVFICHSMGGLIVKQMLSFAKNDPKFHSFFKQTRGTVFYSTPHWGSKLADMPWKMGLVLRPAPTVEDLRSTSPRLDDLNKTLRQLYKSGQVSVLSFSEDVASPLYQTYGGIAIRLEVVPVESAYPGFGDIVVLKGVDHVNSCKPRDKRDVIYAKLLDFLKGIET